MIQLRLRTEFSFRRAFGKAPEVLAAAQAAGGGTAAAITDNGTWGHVAWAKACAAAGVKPIFGWECLVVGDASARTKQFGTTMAVLARDAEGLKELYNLATRSNLPDSHFYYVPRLDYTDLKGISDHCWVLSGVNPDLSRYPGEDHFLIEFNPLDPGWVRRAPRDRRAVVCSNNLYPLRGDRVAYEVMMMARERQQRITPQYVLSPDELRLAMPGLPEEAFAMTEQVAESCTITGLTKAINIHYNSPISLRAHALAQPRASVLERPGYMERFDREIDLIHLKGFDDYFFVIADMVAFAKGRMFVGPARGSAAGSLVCYVLGITDIDPMPHDLLFERFIDITREDVPDIDLDFPDNQREEVMAYLKERYGEDRVGRLGTINRYAVKSALNDVAASLKIPRYEVDKVSSLIIERSSGDARAAFAIADALEGLEVGKALVAKYPGLLMAGRLEGHARHSGTHAAGVVVTEHPLTNYASIDRTGTVQLDKYDAERLNLMKIDVLGLRTLTVLGEALRDIGKTPEWLVNYPLDDADAFGVLNREMWSGVFQFEGYALQNLTKAMRIREFNDIVSITAMARPGPLHSGATDDFIRVRIGERPYVPIHPAVEDVVRETCGIVIYQEQVMAITRSLGSLSWEEVSQLRRAMSKSLGEEFFNQYWEKFAAGAVAQGVPLKEAREVWDKVCTFGSWAFNKSHAVSYGLISYWCTVLKAHHPIQFAAATLRHERDSGGSVRLLRELVREGTVKYVPVDPEESGLEWSISKDGSTLLGGLTAIKGIGPSKAKQILSCRESGKPLPPGLARTLANPETPYDDIFECERRWGDWYKNPRAHQVMSGPVVEIRKVHAPGEYRIIGRMVEKNPRDLNETSSLAKRGGKIMTVKNLFLNLVLEDDTDSIYATVDRWAYERLGKKLVEEVPVGSWVLWKGVIKNEWRRLYISSWRLLGPSKEVEAEDGT